MTTITPQSGTRRERDRTGYADYQRAAMKLASFSRHFAALAAETIPDPDLQTFARPAASHLVSAYEELAAFYAMAAEQAQVVADDYKRHLAAS
jgi:hypothetical protein